MAIAGASVSKGKDTILDALERGELVCVCTCTVRKLIKCTKLLWETPFSSRLQKYNLGAIHSSDAQISGLTGLCLLQGSLFGIRVDEFLRSNAAQLPCGRSTVIGFTNAHTLGPAVAMGGLRQRLKPKSI